MGAITTLAKRVNRVAKDTREHHEQALDGGVMAILPSSPLLGGRLSGMLGVPVGDRTAATLLVIPLGAGDDVRAAALEVAARSRQNHRTLVLIVCALHERGRIERGTTDVLTGRTPAPSITACDNHEVRMLSEYSMWKRAEVITE